MWPPTRTGFRFNTHQYVLKIATNYRMRIPEDTFNEAPPWYQGDFFLFPRVPQASLPNEFFVDLNSDAMNYLTIMNAVSVFERSASDQDI
jgi:hypothetical protein